MFDKCPGLINIDNLLKRVMTKKNQTKLGLFDFSNEKMALNSTKKAHNRNNSGQISVPH